MISDWALVFILLDGIQKAAEYIPLIGGALECIHLLTSAHGINR